MSRRLRAIDAMGLGPVWTMRGVSSIAPVAARAVREVSWCMASTRDGAAWLVIGDAIPSASPARRLLDAMLAAVGAASDGALDVGDADEIVRTHRPDVILVLGPVAAASLFDGASVGRGASHRRWNDRDVPVVVTHHPEHLLESPADKAEAWADLCLARASAALRGSA